MELHSRTKVAELSVVHAAADLESVRLLRSELRDAMTALEQALAAPVPGRVPRWAERVHVALVELSGDLRAHIELTEAPDGLHAEVVSTAPRLAGAVHRLGAEHVEITRAVDELLSLLDPPVPDDVVPLARERGVVLLGKLVRHRQIGADLVYEAYQADIGGAD